MSVSFLLLLAKCKSAQGVLFLLAIWYSYLVNIMRFAFSFVLLAATLPSHARAFLPRSTLGRTSPSSSLLSSVAVDDVNTAIQFQPPASKGAISMSLDELALSLGGRGRARLAWDCYSIGVDPALFYGKAIQLGHDDFESILELLPSNRRSQRLGPDALSKLAALYPNTGKVEGGVASLSYVTQSSDQTTKLLLRLTDGFEIETVIIPWKGSRSTLCISSQVGCRQVRCGIVVEGFVWTTS